MIQLNAMERSCPLVNDLSGRVDDEADGPGSRMVLVMTVTPEAPDADGVAEGVGVPVV